MTPQSEQVIKSRDMEHVKELYEHSTKYMRENRLGGCSEKTLFKDYPLNGLIQQWNLILNYH